MTTDYRAELQLLFDAAESFTEPALGHHRAWQAAMNRARLQLDQPEQEGLTDEELDALEQQCYAPVEVYHGRFGEFALDSRRYARAAIAADRGRWSNSQGILDSSPQPQPKDLTQIALQMLGTIESMELIIPEITDTIRKALEQGRPAPQPEPLPTHDLSSSAPLLWLLWNHQGGKSPVGQPIRDYLGMGQFESMSDAQIGAANEYRRSLLVPPQPPADGEVAELVEWLLCEADYQEIACLRAPCADRIRLAAELLQRQHPQPVAVSERLPEPSVKVLAHYFNALGKGRTICAIWVPAKSRSDDGDLDADDFLEYDEENDKYHWPEGWYEAIENWEELGWAKVYEGEIAYWQPLPHWPANALPTP